MAAPLDTLVSQYENGSLSRRELLATLAALIVAAPTAAQTQPAIGEAQGLNHVTIYVSDVQRSVEFYQRLFGMPVLTQPDPAVNLKVGQGFLAVNPAQDRPIGINHFCLSLDNFNADATLKELTDLGLEAEIRPTGETKQLYFTDPDGVRVQLQDTSYIGGVGPLGNRRPT